ncbi:hypothetical protein MSAN_02081200 [Mycena sanguinolenta]|uniref:Uncharacterized protein n=1 Tax=Mycena sanguinolenta TaxID=230812 RepID=A0A8H7CKE6_9AGAR|nr:hypothetical protein MSAN_02081200 [Mycena sanguinolenta]
MSSIPPELIGLIVSKIDHFPVLKACSLAGSIFCGPSQRILFHSVRLKVPCSPKFCTFLEDSPHVAPYIINLDLLFGPSTPDTALDLLQRIFSRLTNVRRCRIIGQLPSRFCLPPHQPLRELDLKGLRASPAVLFHLLLTGPPLHTLSCSFVYLTERADDLPVGLLQNAPKIENLELKDHTSGLYELLLHPQLKPYTSTMRGLSMRAFDDPNSRLTFQTAHTLEHISLGFSVIHFTLAASSLTEIPLLLKGEVPNPSSSSLGSGNWSTFPKAIVFGGAFEDAQIEALRKAVTETPGTKRIPWLRVDWSRPHPPIGPEYAAAIVERTKAMLSKLESEGKFDVEDDSIYLI